MTTSPLGSRALRWAWALPALLSGVLTAAVVLVLSLIVPGHDQGGLERHRIAAPTSQAATSQAATGVTTAGRPDLTLEPDGLGLVGFGQPADTVISALTDRLGTPDENADQPCEKDPATQSRWLRWADLSLRFGAGGFAAYIEGVHFPPGREAFGFATARGLAPGDSVERLHEIYGESVPIRTQAPSAGRPATAIFTISSGQADGAISGVIEQPGRSGTVVSIFAGELC